MGADDFFSFDTTASAPQCIQYLKDTTTAINVLCQYLTIKKMFLKYNTTVPFTLPALITLALASTDEALPVRIRPLTVGVDMKGLVM